MDHGQDALLNEWWEKNFPSNSPRAKIVRYLAEFGPSSAYQIAKYVYASAFSGYASIHKNLAQLVKDRIVCKVRTETGRNRRKKIIYGLTPTYGIPTAWAYLGPSLDFERLLENHKTVFKKSDGLDTYKVIWNEAGSVLANQIARKSYISIISGVNEGQGLVDEIIASIVDGSIPEKVIIDIGVRSPRLRDTLRAIHRDSGNLLKEIERSSNKTKRGVSNE